MPSYRYDGPDERHYPFLPDGDGFASVWVKPGDVLDLPEAPDGWWTSSDKPAPPAPVPADEPAEPAETQE
jgi:hypothetical protein